MTQAHNGSIYWYDLETSGTNPRWDRVIQFAGVRTDLALNEIGDEFCSYVQLPVDVLPSPGATLVTGITPQRTRAEGVDEWQAFRRVLKLFSTPGTCVAGYNSLRFDDEFVRYGLYRMLLDPYAREWQNGNSRWDLIDLLRAAYALRPEGINWPQADGLPVFRLEKLSVANGISHANAHDAMADVRATIGMGRLIREHQPLLFDYYYKARGKQAIRDLLEPIGRKLCVHVSGMYGRERSCIAPVVSVARHPQNNNSYVVADVSQDIRPLLEWDAEHLAEALFAPGGSERPPLKEVRINRCPFLSGANVLRPQDLTRLQLSLEQAQQRQQQLQRANVAGKLAAVYANRPAPESADVDAALYDGFIKDADKQRSEEFQQSLLNGVWPEQIAFDDERLQALSGRLKARCFPHLLTDGEQQQWLQFVRTKLGATQAPWLTLAAARRELTELALSAPAAATTTLTALDNYYVSLGNELGVSS